MWSASQRINPLQTRIANAKTYLSENPTKKPLHAATIFDVSPQTLYSSIARDKKPVSETNGNKGGNNKILGEHQEKVVHDFVRNLLLYNIQPTHGVVFNAIIALKRAQNPTRKPPTPRWFSDWWKKSQLHKIKTKPLANVRFTAAQEKDVKEWFCDYRKVLIDLKIKDKNIINFDEAGFRVGCIKGHQILVPLDIKEVYEISPENRKSLTIFESINATGSYPPPPLILVQGQDIMMDWFPKELPAGTRIIPTENGFTTDEVALEWLQHYIKHSDSGPEADWKLLLMDNHGSHCTPEFVLLANENHIRPYPLIAHLTHCMQPLDVGVFQPYKHWHDDAIQTALMEFNTEYTLPRFLQDLTKIRDETFKPGTIRHAFEKSGMWPVNAQKCIEQLKVFNPNIEKEISVEPTLPQPRVPLRREPSV